MHLERLLAQDKLALRIKRLQVEDIAAAMPVAAEKTIVQKQNIPGASEWTNRTVQHDTSPLTLQPVEDRVEQ